MKHIPNRIFFSQVEADLSAGLSVSFKVKGNSMFPLLRSGKDIVFISPANQQLVKGDIVLFKFNGTYVLHRIIQIKGNLFIMQGDGTINKEEFCNRNDIIGVVTHISRDGKVCKPLCSLRYRLYIKFWNTFSFARKYLLFILRLVF